MNEEKPSDDIELEDNVSVDDGGNETETLMMVEKAIRLSMSKIERLKENQKPVREMIDSLLANDEEYVAFSEEAKRASKQKSGAKKRVLSSENGEKLSTKAVGIKESLKEANESFSYYLREYQRMTGLNEFEGEDGELRQIVYIAKLVRKTNLNS
ncbi:hypothetical protein KKB40_03655 [Patescibacteria group bacterium]|nr:hypothetical protein [Patescibacteria group bacterium]